MKKNRLTNTLNFTFSKLFPISAVIGNMVSFLMFIILYFRTYTISYDIMLILGIIFSTIGLQILILTFIVFFIKAIIYDYLKKKKFKRCQIRDCLRFATSTKYAMHLCDYHAKKWDRIQKRIEEESGDTS